MLLNDLDVRFIYEATGSISNRKLPFKLSYRLSKIVAQLESAYKITETARLELVREYATEDGNIPKEKLAEFYDKFNTLMDGESSEYGNIAPIPASLFDDQEIEVSILKSLFKVIDENA